MAILRQSNPGKLAAKWCRWLLWLAFVLGANRVSGLETAREYQLKAVFLFNFAQFVEWPTNAFASANTPLVIGLLGENPFGTALDEAVRNEKVNGHSFLVKICPEAKDAKNCHVMFVGRSKANKVDEVLASCIGQPILTVGETSGFVKKGGVIQFSTEKSKIRLFINVTAAKASNLVVSSKPLRLAEVMGVKEN
jgi:hypothetical protein